MTTKYIEEGKTLDYTNAGSAIASGDVVIVAGLIGVAHDDIAATTGTGVLHTDGVFELPKVSAAVIAAGEDVIWDVSAGAFDDNLATPGTGDVSKGATAWEAAGNGVTTVKVKLHGVAGTVN